MTFRDTNRQAGTVYWAATLSLASREGIAALALILLSAFGSTAVLASVRPDPCPSRSDIAVVNTCEIRHLALCPSWGIAEAYWNQASIHTRFCPGVDLPTYDDKRDDRDWRQHRRPHVA
jgi:hypothetical protein